MHKIFNATIKAIKKQVAVILSISLMFSSVSFASASQPKDINTIKIMLTSPDKYKKEAGAGNYILWAVLVTAVAKVSHSIGKNSGKAQTLRETEKDVAIQINTALSKEKLISRSEGYRAGFAAGKESTLIERGELFSAGKKLGYSEVAKEEGLPLRYLISRTVNDITASFMSINEGENIGKLTLTREEKEAVALLRRETRNFQQKLATTEGVNQAKAKISVFIFRAGSQEEALRNAISKEERSAARAELSATVRKMKALPLPDSASKKVVTEYVKELQGLLSGKGGMTGVAALCVTAGLTAMFLGDDDSEAVSDKRLLVQKEISFTIQHCPELLTAKAIALKEKYGLNIVASVISEHEEAVKLLKIQAEDFKSPEVRRAASSAVNMGFSSSTPQYNKQELIGALYS